MTASALAPVPGAVRPARASDDAALVRLAAACPMPGEIALCQTRAPRFFALTELESLGHDGPGRVLVADGPGGEPVGCIAWTERLCHLHGRPTRTAYISDFKVHPDHRTGALGDALSAAVREDIRAAGGDDMPTLLTVLAGNARMARRLPGPRGLPRLERFADLDTLAVPWLRRRRRAHPEIDVAPARREDLDEMIALWQRLAPARQFAPVLDGARLDRFLRRAPALHVGSYWLARRRADRALLGYFAAWDQACFKQSVVVRWSRRLAAVRWLWNRVATPLLGAPPLPPAGQPLRYMTAFHLAVPTDRPDVLRALTLGVQQALSGQGHAFLAFGLDRRDPLGAGLRGLWAQPTRISACVTSPAGGYRGRPLDDRPLHFEIALV
jgi:ribosomal protein S18 acetylase RimI-like enzyme